MIAVDMEGARRMLDGLAPALEAELARALDGLLPGLETDLRRRTPVGTGRLAASIAVTPVSVSGGRLAGGVGYTAPHAEAVELGTRPHRPPIADLIAWARAKGLEAPERAAHAVAATIAKRGTPARHPLRDTMRGLDRRLAAAAGAAVARAVAKVGEGA
ncbi:MAG TPA: HK97 gp10 family phage protein [Azospirillaceae bacterium]|nr:HK97 gp10 family phage protein [Azospirillaceae bacterium]